MITTYIQYYNNMSVFESRAEKMSPSSPVERQNGGFHSRRQTHSKRAFWPPQQEQTRRRPDVIKNGEETPIEQEALEQEIADCRKRIENTRCFPAGIINLWYYAGNISAFHTPFKGQKINARLAENNNLQIFLGDSSLPSIEIDRKGKCYFWTGSCVKGEEDVRLLLNMIMDYLG